MVGFHPGIRISKTPTKASEELNPFREFREPIEKFRRVEPVPRIPRTHLRRRRLTTNQATNPLSPQNHPNPLSRNSYLRSLPLRLPTLLTFPPTCETTQPRHHSPLNNSDGEKIRKNEPRNSPRCDSGPLLLLLVLPPPTTRPRRRLLLRYGPDRGGIHGWNC